MKYRAVVVVIVWWLVWQLHAQSLHIATYVVTSNPNDREVYSIQQYVIKFVRDLRHVAGYLRFHPPTNLTATILMKYCWKWL